MSLEKAIFYGKEHRKQYRDIREYDFDCRNHGTCTWCMGNRLYKYMKKIEKTNIDINNYKKGNYNDL